MSTVPQNRFRKALRGLSTALSLTIASVVAVLIMEAVLRIAFVVRDGATGSAVADERALLPAYEGVAYDPNVLWREIWENTNFWLRYEPYSVWRRKPYAGTLLNVSDTGLRATAFNSSSDDALSIWMFGGSTTWGMGVPDSGTVPSLLARALNDRGVPVRVTNFGETGYVSTQDLIEFVRALQRENPPAIAIFYQGANEPLGVTDAPDVATPHYLLADIAARFEGNRETGGGFESFVRGTAMFRFANGIAGRLPGTARSSETAPPQYAVPLDRVPELARFNLDAYWVGSRVIEAFAAEYGVTTYQFWQPRLGVGEKPLHATERRQLERLRATPGEDWNLRFSTVQLELVRAASAAGSVPPRFYDISDTFAAITAPLYLDWVHLADRGNELIAQRIAQAVIDDQCRAPSKNGLAAAFANACERGGKP